MKTFFNVSSCLCIMLMITGCSKKITLTTDDIIGYYSLRVSPLYTKSFEESSLGYHIEDLLELKADGTFIYEQFYIQYNGFDVGPTRFGQITGGHFILKQSKLIFDESIKPEIKDINQYFIRESNKMRFYSFGGTFDTFRVVKRNNKIKIGKMLKVKDISKLTDYFFEIDLQ